MRKIKEVLRLKFEAKLSHEKITAATGISKGAVTRAVQRAAQQGLAWPLPAQLDEAGIENECAACLFCSRHAAQFIVPPITDKGPAMRPTLSLSTERCSR